MPGTEMGMLELVSDYFVLIFSRKSSGMRMDSMGLVFQALDIWRSDSKWTKTDARLFAPETLATSVVPTCIDRNTSQNVPSVT